MIISMIARPHTVALTCVGLMMTILVKRRNVDSGMTLYTMIFFHINSSLVLGTQGNMCMPMDSLHEVTTLIIPIFRCAVDVHLCGEPCKLKGKKWCLGECTKV